MTKFAVVEVDENEIEVVRSETGEFATLAEAKQHAINLYYDRQCDLEDQISERHEDISGFEDHLEELNSNRSELEALEEKDVRDEDEV